MRASMPDGDIAADGLVKRAFPPGVDPAGRVLARHAWPLSAPLALAALPGAQECASLHALLLAAEWGTARLADAAAYVAGELVAAAIAASAGLPGQPVVRCGCAVTANGCSSRPGMPSASRLRETVAGSGRLAGWRRIAAGMSWTAGRPAGPCCPGGRHLKSPRWCTSERR